MASAKRVGEGGSESGEGMKKVGQYNLADLLPEGHSEKDVILTGQLLPQYLGKEHLDRAKAKGLDISQIPIVCGLIDRIEVLPIQEHKNQKDFAPFSIVVRDLKVPTIGFRGPRDKREEVAVEKMGSILFPVTGQTSVNRDVMKALRDPEYLYWISVEVIGEKVVNNMNPMIDHRVQIIRTKEKRADRGGAWALDAWYMACLTSGDLLSSVASGEHRGLVQTAFSDGLEVTPVGNLINRKSGELIGRLGPTGAVLPPSQMEANPS